MKNLETNKVTIFKSQEGKNINVSISSDTIWLSLTQISALFERDKSVISRHINAVYKEKELEKKATIAKNATVQKEGDRNINRTIEFYNLDVIISVGYRVKSKQGTQFRIWANQILKQYLIDGYALNENKLKKQSSKIKTLESTIKSIVSAAHEKPLTDSESKGVLKVIQDYTLALDLLDQYDHQNLKISDTNKVSEKFISYEEALGSIETLREKFRKDGESVDLFGKEKDQSFHSSITTIYQTFDGKELYPSVEEKAAHLLYFVIKNHSFVDGNKRIAAFLFVWFLERSNYLYTLDGKKRIEDNGLVALCLLVAHSKPEEKDTFTKLIVNLINKKIT
ncbi:virulence protein RhuM/Fic/DOC family protein [bacterium]|jgi:prophage maintenance system killer protein|nr:virulence protein RhuM/Fic/DOC family protein [bacterium]